VRAAAGAAGDTFWSTASDGVHRDWRQYGVCSEIASSSFIQLA
jgi:hypothetical protein